MTKIYHGSHEIVKKPSFHHAQKYRRNDYGPGFYTAFDDNMGREWAVRPDANGNVTDGYLNIYELDTKGLKLVDLNQSCYSVLNWAALVFKNRRFSTEDMASDSILQRFIEKYAPDTRNADIIIGYRADDSYFTYAKEFALGNMSLDVLTSSLHAGNMGQQLFIKSEEAFNRIQFVDYETVDAKGWYPKYKNRDLTARLEVRKMINQERLRGANLRENRITIDDIVLTDKYNVQNNSPELVGRGYEIPKDCEIVQAPWRAMEKHFKQQGIGREFSR